GIHNLSSMVNMYARLPNTLIDLMNLFQEDHLLSPKREPTLILDLRKKVSVNSLLMQRVICYLKVATWMVVKRRKLTVLINSSWYFR
ncbi:MAG: hypothetical protein ABIR03_01360, partial [Ginsengibacter sp.]